MDGTSRLRLPDGTELQHGLMTACFADRTVVAAAGVVPLPDGLPLWQAALLGCGVVTGIGAVRNVARLGIGDTACVIGCGGVGLQVIAGARLAGASRIVAIDRHPEKVALALRRGATDGIDSATEDARKAVLRLCPGGVDHSFEVVGQADTIRLAWDVVRPGGDVVVIGLAPKGVEVTLPAIEFLSEKTIRGCYYGSANVAAALPRLAVLARDGVLDLAGVVSHFTELDGVEEAFDRLRRADGARTIVVVEPELAEAPL
jgi:S-(hydroxymethyl)glutathione dehydrogenase/alcohol dehydrogenase